LYQVGINKGIRQNYVPSKRRLS